LSSLYSAKKKSKQQQQAYNDAMAEKAARTAHTAEMNKAWVPTPYRTRNTAVQGPTVADRYGISSGNNPVNRPSSYDYFTNNHVQLARGGLAQLRQPHVRGNAGGQDDDVPAMLSSGEYVFDADTVAALGDGNNTAGALKLDKMRANVRTHKRAAPADKIPAKAKAPEAYLPKKGK
jgi:hypothetical protein